MTPLKRASRTYGYDRDQSDSAGAVNYPYTSVACPWPWEMKSDKRINFDSGINEDGAFMQGGFGIHGLIGNEKKKITMREIGQLSMQSGDLSIPI
jgi:hypothetical protein